MNVEQLKAISRSVALLGQALDGYERVIAKEHLLDVPFRGLFQFDLANFAIYLAAADNEVTEDEVHYISQVLGLALSEDEIETAIRMNGMQDGSYGEKVPRFFKVLKRIADMQKEADAYDGSLETFYRFFEEVGRAMVETDGTVSESELSKMKVYLETIKQYIGL